MQGTLDSVPRLRGGPLHARRRWAGDHEALGLQLALRTRRVLSTHARLRAKLIPGVFLWGVDIVYRFFKVPHAQQGVQAREHERFFTQIVESRKSLKITSLVELPGGIIRLVFAPVDPR